jgi:hypothetical protein
MNTECAVEVQITINHIPSGTREIAGSESVPTQTEAHLTTKTVQNQQR